MILNKTKILLFVPVFILLGWTLSVQSMISQGEKMDLPVRGYDPRDILAGRYLSVSVDYDGFPSECKVDENKESGGRLRAADKKRRELLWKKRDAFFCPDSGRIVLERPEECRSFIKGYCYDNRFYDGISRFYVSEKKAGILEKAVRDKSKKPMLRVSVTPDGRAYPLDLLLEEIPYKEWLKGHQYK